MTEEVLVYGAGSIGTHLAQASRRIGWNVTVIDTDPEALRRMREEVYPARYGAWDHKITCIPTEGFTPRVRDYEIIMVGTPPDSHVALTREALALQPQLLHVEKPLFAAPDDLCAFERVLRAAPQTTVTVGYDHGVARSVTEALQEVKSGRVGTVTAIDVTIHASFADILAAHPWLKGIRESYLSNWRRGGGALQEHSHGLHLGLLFASAAGKASLQVCSAALDFDRSEGLDFDRLAHVVLQGEDVCVHVVEDVFTRPTRKEVVVRGTEGTLTVRLAATLDTFELHDITGELVEVRRYPKTRPDDFFALVEHYADLCVGDVSIEDSPVRVETGIEVMRFIREAFKGYR